VQGAGRVRAVLRGEDAALSGQERLRLGFYASRLPGVGGGAGKTQAGMHPFV